MRAEGERRTSTGQTRSSQPKGQGNAKRSPLLAPISRSFANLPNGAPSVVREGPRVSLKAPPPSSIQAE